MKATHITLFVILIILVAILGQPKVADLHHIVLGQQDIPGRQVTVNILNSNSSKTVKSAIWKSDTEHHLREKTLNEKEESEKEERTRTKNYSHTKFQPISYSCKMSNRKPASLAT